MSDELLDDERSSSSKSFLQIPCMRRSLLYGIGGGVSTGLGVFMFTSNVRKATNFAVGAYAILATITWSVCRYNFTRERFQGRLIKEALESAVFQKIEVENSENE